MGNLSKKELKKIRANSDMGDPDVWKFHRICDDCINRLGGGCDLLEIGDMTEDEFREVQKTNTCEMFIKKS